VRLLLVDKSAYVRGLVDVVPGDELCLCAVTRLEMLCSARSFEDFARLEDDLDQFRDLRMDVETLAIARTTQGELAALGQHRVAVPDLLVAACAQQHGADVIHVDRHFDVLATVLRFRSERLDAR